MDECLCANKTLFVDNEIQISHNLYEINFSRKNVLLIFLSHFKIQIPFLAFLACKPYKNRWLTRSGTWAIVLTTPGLEIHINCVMICLMLEVLKGKTHKAVKV